MGILNRLQGWMQWLTSDPAGFILYLLYFAVSVLLTLTLHEIAHGYVAWKCGDPTAKMLGACLWTRAGIWTRWVRCV